MRRADREVKDVEEILELIKKCEVCSLGLCDNSKPYVVPLNFGCEYASDKLTLYFHCAKQGKKLDLIRENPSAFFEMHTETVLQTASEDCHCTMEYISVMGDGVIEILNDRNDKIHALELLMRQYIKKDEFHFPEAALNAVEVLAMKVDSFTGKRNQKK